MEHPGVNVVMEHPGVNEHMTDDLVFLFVKYADFYGIYIYCALFDCTIIEAKQKEEVGATEAFRPKKRCPKNDVFLGSYGGGKRRNGLGLGQIGILVR